jgi:hypothetical protein
MPTKAEIEAAARAARRVAADWLVLPEPWDDLPEEAKKRWREMAGAALDAAERVREIL